MSMEAAIKILAQAMGAEDVNAVEMNCHRHGPFKGAVVKVDGREYLPTCPVCQLDRISYQTIDQAQAQAEQIQQEHRERLSAQVPFTGIPKRFRGKRFESYQPHSDPQQYAFQSCQEFAREVLAGSGETLILTGKKGTGKTHLAAAIGVQIQEQLGGVIFTTTNDMLTRIRHGMKDDTEWNAMKPFRDARLLILDEVGQNIDSQAARRWMFDILNHRYAEMLPTVLISNLPLKSSEPNVPGLDQVLGPYLIDRLKEGYQAVAFDWESYRGCEASA